MKSPDFKLLVFDWDGTLMDSEAHIVSCLQAASAELELEPLPDAVMKNIIGLGLRDAVDTLYPGRDEEFRQRFGAAYRRHFFAPTETPSRLFSGARETLLELRERGYLLAVATGKGRQGLDKALHDSGLAPLFHSTRCAEEAGSKPDPRMLLEILEETGIEAAETVMIGDTEYDMQMAFNARTHAVAVSYGVHDRERLLRWRPLACLDAITELSDWLEHYRTRDTLASRDGTADGFGEYT